jgi:hypothetical protein
MRLFNIEEAIHGPMVCVYVVCLLYMVRLQPSPDQRLLTNSSALATQPRHYSTRTAQSDGQHMAYRKTHQCVW